MVQIVISLYFMQFEPRYIKRWGSLFQFLMNNQKFFKYFSKYFNEINYEFSRKSNFLSCVTIRMDSRENALNMHYDNFSQHDSRAMLLCWCFIVLHTIFSRRYFCQNGRFIVKNTYHYLGDAGNSIFYF